MFQFPDSSHSAEETQKSRAIDPFGGFVKTPDLLNDSFAGHGFNGETTDRKAKRGSAAPSSHQGNNWSREGKRKQGLTCTLVVVIKPVLGNTFDGYLHGFSSVNRHGNQRRQASALSSTGLRLKGHGLRRVANERKRRKQARTAVGADLRLLTRPIFDSIA